VPYVIGRRCSNRIDRDVHQRVLLRYGQSLSARIITSPLARSESAFCAFEMRHSDDIHCCVIVSVTVVETAQWMAGSNHDTVMCPKYLKAKGGLFHYGGEGGFWRNFGLSVSCFASTLTPPLVWGTPERSRKERRVLISLFILHSHLITSLLTPHELSSW
jgi:hypothetical protein